MTMPDVQRYYKSDKNVEETVVFLTRKVIISVSFSIASYKRGMRKQVTFAV